MALTRSMTKKTADNSGHSETASAGIVKASTDVAVGRDAAGATAKDRTPSHIRDVMTREAPNPNHPTENSIRSSVLKTAKARRGHAANPSRKSRRARKDTVKESGSEPASVLEPVIASGFPSSRQGQKRRKEEDEGNKENEAIHGQRPPPTNARRVRRRTARDVSDEAEATPQNTNSSVTAEDLPGSRFLRRIPSRTEYSVDEVIATVALLQLASGKPNWSTSTFPTSSEVEGNPVLVSEPTLSLCNHNSEQNLKRIGIPGIEAVVVLVGA